MANHLAPALFSSPAEQHRANGAHQHMGLPTLPTLQAELPSGLHSMSTQTQEVGFECFCFHGHCKEDTGNVGLPGQLLWEFPTELAFHTLLYQMRGNLASKHTFNCHPTGNNDSKFWSSLGRCLAEQVQSMVAPNDSWTEDPLRILTTSLTLCSGTPLQGSTGVPSNCPQSTGLLCNTPLASPCSLLASLAMLA